MYDMYEIKARELGKHFPRIERSFYIEEILIGERREVKEK
jgi:hypothetical protein